MKNHRFVYVFLLINIISMSVLFTGCSKQKPNRAVIEKHCHDKILEMIKSKPLSRIEKRFFKDGKSRGILKAEQISPKNFAEGVSSATASSYIQEFIFVDQKGQKIQLVRDATNGGIDVNSPNIMSPYIQCKVIWGLFKGEVMEESLKIIMASQDHLQQKMRELEGLVE